MEEENFETDGLFGKYTVQNVKKSRYILYGCSRKTFLLPSNETDMPGLTKEEFTLANESRNMFHSLEKLLGSNSGPETAFERISC